MKKKKGNIDIPGQAAELRRKAAFNQLEQQEIIVEGLMRVLAELESPPAGWEG